MRRMIRRIGAGMLSLALAVSLVSVSGKEVKADGTKDYRYVITTSSNPPEVDNVNDNGAIKSGGVVCYKGDTVTIVPGTPHQPERSHSATISGVVESHYAYDLTEGVADPFTGTGSYEVTDKRYGG